MRGCECLLRAGLVINTSGRFALGHGLISSPWLPALATARLSFLVRDEDRRGWPITRLSELGGLTGTEPLGSGNQPWRIWISEGFATLPLTRTK